ncbi:hypothetical protein [Paucilactobacillus sp. N302-9]
MSKGFWLGVSASAIAAAIAYQSLSEERKEQLAQTVRDTFDDLKDQVTDYAFFAEDLADDWRQTANDYKEDAQEMVTKTSDKFKEQKEKIADHFNNDDFEEQTASIRDQLASTASTDEDDSEDIIIDQTKTDDESEE